MENKLTKRQEMYLENLNIDEESKEIIRKIFIDDNEEIVEKMKKDEIFTNNYFN